MIARRGLRGAAQDVLRHFGYNIYRLTDAEREAYRERQRVLHSDTLEGIFGAELARLQDLRNRYAQVQLPVALHSVWGMKGGTSMQPDIGWGGVDLRTFRGHNAYVWSYTSSDLRSARLLYYVYAQAARSRDAARLFDKLTEDGAFGCLSFDYPHLGRVSRDLMDSIIEINFLDKHLQILSRKDFGVLDIGAGYGRMAHRLLESAPGLTRYTCVDAVPESTFLSEFYLKHRDLLGRATVLPLDEISQSLKLGQHTLALNIHSFSECTYTAIEWWLRKVAELDIRYLMIIPNDPDRFLSMETDQSRRDYAPLLEQLGFHLRIKEPVFDDPAVREMIANDWIYLFEQQT